MVPKTCSVDGCDRKAFCKGFCTQHYQANKRHGTPTPFRPSESERFWSKVDKAGPDECWLWTAATRSGYGLFNVPPTTIRAHRYAYIEAKGQISDGMVVDHICHVPLCCNPAHLQAVTPKQNTENHSGPTRRSSSGIRGVFWSPDGRWIGQVGHAGRVYSAGSHSTKEAAGKAVVELRNKLHTNNLKDREWKASK